MGSRGASSSINKVGENNIQSYEQLIKTAGNMKTAIVFNKGIDKLEKTSNKMSSVTTHKISDLSSVMEGINETIIRVDTGMYNRRVEALKKLGYKVLARTKEGQNAYSQMLVHIKKGK